VCCGASVMVVPLGEPHAITTNSHA